MWSGKGVRLRPHYPPIPPGSSRTPDGGTLVPSLIWGLQVVQGLRVVLVFLYRYGMNFSLKKARSPRTTEGGRSD
jgi:hypothetical protein